MGSILDSLTKRVCDIQGRKLSLFVALLEIYEILMPVPFSNHHSILVVSSHILLYPGYIPEGTISLGYRQGYGDQLQKCEASTTYPWPTHRTLSSPYNPAVPLPVVLIRLDLAHRSLTFCAEHNFTLIK
jgi:hypothetical protein